MSGQAIAPGEVRRLRVVRVYLHLNVGGIEKRLVDLLPRLNRDRFEVQFVCIRRRGTLAPVLEESGIPVHHCHHHSRLPFAVSTWIFGRFLGRLRPDIVHAHGAVSMLLATGAARRAGVPVILGNCHNVGVFSKEREILLERRLSALRDATIHVSRSVYEDYLEQVRPDKRDGVILYNGVDADRFAAAVDEQRRAALAQEIGIESGHPVLINVARLHRHKAHEDLLVAFARVRERFPRAVLLLVGDGRRHAEIESLVRESGMTGAVRMLGARSDVRDLYHLAHVNVLSSMKEGFSNVVLEAMAAGLPQVLTDVGGNREALGDSESGLIVPPRKPEALADAVMQIIGDPDRAAAMSGAAARRAEDFSAREQLRRTEELYLELASRKGLLS